jgi:hypothetical protein
MQFEERQKTDCGSAPRKWNGTKGGHPKHRRRTKSIRSSQSILCRIFFPIEFSIEFPIARKKYFIFFPKRGGRQYTNRKRYRGAIKVLRRHSAAA